MANTLTFVGRLTANPVFATVSDKNGVNRSKCSFCVAEGEGDRTQFIQCIAWDNWANFINKYYLKGDMVHIASELRITQKMDTKETFFTAFVNSINMVLKSKNHYSQNEGVNNGV